MLWIWVWSMQSLPNSINTEWLKNLKKFKTEVKCYSQILICTIGRVLQFCRPQYWWQFVVNGKLYYIYICIMLHYNSALLLTVDLIYTPKSFYCFVHWLTLLTNPMLLCNHMDENKSYHINNPTVSHSCVYSEKLLMMDRGTVRNM